jgi:hypothetical protein
MANLIRSVFPGTTAALLITVLSGCQIGPPPVLGSGVSKAETRAVTDFDEIDVSNAVRLELTVGPVVSLEVISDDNLLPLVKTEITGTRLRVFVDRNVSTNVGITIKATTPTLKALEGSGATTSNVTGVSAETFALNLSGASTCKLTGATTQMSVDLSGASQCTLTGEVERLTINCSGASRADSTKAPAKTVEVELSGASTADLFVSEELTAKASGASTVRYLGQPEKLTQTVSGAATVRPK